ncbi:hypothetical protein BDY21DRAFT_351637 [Lineolata rhizophorae]|uniref:Large ribosomal subunit protein mL59 domain-containing protein n=1 Tax=Lineolata rhizophorae TaxID=578093 RepID=A0A6A6NSV3_9PEZI|nr:hypothetical protein BDY21DRAFT_351637 [Lineolata rhizophorae]
MASRQQQIALAQNLPRRLLNFFRKYPPPPQVISAHFGASSIAAGPAPSTPTPTTEAGVSAPPSDTAVATTETSTVAAASEPVDPRTIDLGYHNPFLPKKIHTTGKWQGPRYGLREQADLCKMARKYGVEDLLPWSRKKSGERERRRMEQGLRVKGTGVGERVKGKKWERTLRPRLETRKKAMLEMPQLIEYWKSRGHGKFLPKKMWPKK